MCGLHTNNNWPIPAFKGNYMSEIDDEVIDSTTDEEVIEDETIEETSDDTTESEDSSHDESEDLEKLKEQNRRLFERAKKAEGFIKEDGDWVKKSKPMSKKPEPKAQTIEITPLDTIALMNNKVTEADDINEVLDYARFKNISVADALKSSVVKTTLADKEAERTTAKATSTKGGKKGVSAPDSATIVTQASDGGKLPDDPSVLAKARIEQKKSK